MSLLSHIQDNTPIVTHPIYRLNDVIAYVGNHGYIANETNIHTITPYPCVHVQMYTHACIYTNIIQVLSAYHHTIGHHCFRADSYISVLKSEKNVQI